MADGTTYGINFPFRDSRRGDYLQLTEFEAQQIKGDLVHLLLTRKGTRYYLPDFGTRLYEFLFEPFDGLTFDAAVVQIVTVQTKKGSDVRWKGAQGLIVRPLASS